MRKKLIAMVVCAIATIILTSGAVSNGDEGSAECFNTQPPKVETIIVEPTYTSLGIPNIDSSFKTYMDYRCITNKNSTQYKFIKAWGWCDSNGFMRANGERDLGIKDDYYLIALGSYYGTTIGTKYKITTDTGNVFYGVLADCKDDRHTNNTHQYSYNNDVVEFIVDTKKLNKTVKVIGSVNVYMPLNGIIASIERINF